MAWPFWAESQRADERRAYLYDEAAEDAPFTELARSLYPPEVNGGGGNRAALARMAGRCSLTPR